MDPMVVQQKNLEIYLKIQMNKLKKISENQNQKGSALETTQDRITQKRRQITIYIEYQTQVSFLLI
ncbi:unnamed protein product [Paramecium octaurelia]|uniref:Uncharacterized protein n=1 Tax=Paramecium octaurelia TaxID=43137 RepID=A0A8S1T2V9_PAROT|nr:unnamed protein product [Paramecium octaurelia]